MNNNTIRKIIKINNNSCPEFIYDNPLLDGDIARVLAKSVIKIIQNPENKVNNKLRHCVLTTIRQTCQNKTEGHEILSDNIVEVLLRCYRQSIEDKETFTDDEILKCLDSHLKITFQDMPIASVTDLHHSPEVTQALLNLSDDKTLGNKLKDMVYYYGSDNAIIKSIWNSKLSIADAKLIDEIVIKFLPSIEKELLKIGINLLSTSDCDLNEVLTSNSFDNLLNKCSISSTAFQIFSKITNYMFINSNYNMKIQQFIQMCIKNIKLQNAHIASLYPCPLQSLVLKLDIEVNDIPSALADVLINPVIFSMDTLRSSSEHDFIMLLTHYSQWFDLCTSKKS